MIKKKKRSKELKNEDQELQEMIQSLVLCEKILQSIDLAEATTDIQVVKARLHNAHLLMKAYSKAGDHPRIVRFLGENT